MLIKLLTELFYFILLHNQIVDTNNFPGFQIKKILRIVIREVNRLQDILKPYLQAFPFDPAFIARLLFKIIKEAHLLSRKILLFLPFLIIRILFVHLFFQLHHPMLQKIRSGIK